MGGGGGGGGAERGRQREREGEVSWWQLARLRERLCVCEEFPWHPYRSCLSD